jgi:hypothetical protein
MKKFFLATILFMSISLQTVQAGCTKVTAQDVQMKGGNIGMPSKEALGCVDKILSGKETIKSNPNFIAYFIRVHCGGVKVSAYTSKPVKDAAFKKRNGLEDGEDIMTSKYRVQNDDAFTDIGEQELEVQNSKSDENKALLEEKCTALDEKLHDAGISFIASGSNAKIGPRVE